VRNERAFHGRLPPLIGRSDAFYAPTAADMSGGKGGLACGSPFAKKAENIQKIFDSYLQIESIVL
jgi:hypothetical protein